MGLTYNGTTAGSTLANPPMQLDGLIGGGFPFATSVLNSTAGDPGIAQQGGRVWLYSSTNLGTDLNALNAINDGRALGMKNLDLFIGVTATVASTAPLLYLGLVVTSNGATGVSLSSAIVTSTMA